MANVVVKGYHAGLREIEVEVTLDDGTKGAMTVNRNVMPPNILAEKVLIAVGTAATKDDVIAAVESATYSFPDGIL